MSIAPIAFAESLRIGTIDFVSPDEIKVLLELDAPDNVALNTGRPSAFPRINGYVLIPCDEGYLVGQVEWITIERSQYPKRKGMQDFGLIDLPYPLRKMKLNPVGCLRYADEGEREKYKFERGVQSYPTVGDPVLLPTEKQLRAIVESGDDRHVKIGTSPLAANAEVKIDPDRLFGRHLAVLGNTGSGKSCSVAGLIRWSLEAADKETGDQEPNARFIVLDPNGEYAKAFWDLSTVREFAVKVNEADHGSEDVAPEQLEVPLWFWNSQEWCAFTQAAPRAQRPVLVQALRTVRDGQVDVALSPSTEMRRYLRTIVSALQVSKATGNPWNGTGPIRGFRDRLVVWREGMTLDDRFSTEESDALGNLSWVCDQLLANRQDQWPQAFSRRDIDELLTLAREAHHAFGGGESELLPIDPDVPRPFTGDQFIRAIEANAELLNAVEYVDTMRARVQTLLSNARMTSISSSGSWQLHEWLATYLGDDDSNGTVTVIDLSLVPPEVVHIVTAVVARMTLEALQRYRKLNKGEVLPTVLVMEEAHTFIRRYKDDGEIASAATMCCQVFEKIAREGRKFGLGLVLSSQRPSELSPTVLSQCNTFLLHRISNDKDQEVIHKLVPDNLRGLLRDLPTLPARKAILLGWASELPTLVHMNELPDDQRPQSDDPDFWKVWSRKEPRKVDWKAIANDWQQYRDEKEADDDGSWRGEEEGGEEGSWDPSDWDDGVE